MNAETKAVQAVGDYGYVYIGGYAPAPGVLFIKTGKSAKPAMRSKQYGTMLPGGLTFMRAVRVAHANNAERRLMAAVAAIDGVEPVGGEWFRCEPILKLTVLDELHKFGGAVSNVLPFCPGRYGESKKRVRKWRGRP